MLESLRAIVRYYEARFAGNDDLRRGALELYRDGKSRSTKRSEGCPRLRESARRAAGTVCARIGPNPVPPAAAQDGLKRRAETPGSNPLTFIYLYSRLASLHPQSRA